MTFIKENIFWIFPLSLVTNTMGLIVFISISLLIWFYVIAPVLDENPDPTLTPEEEAAAKQAAGTSTATPAADTTATPAAGTSTATPAADTSTATPAAGTSTATPAAGTSTAIPAAGTAGIDASDALEVDATISITTLGQECPGDTIFMGTTCEYSRGEGVGTIKMCDSNKIYKNRKCYDKPPDGWDWTTDSSSSLVIGKICPEGSQSSGITCQYDRGAGRFPNLAPCGDGLRDDLSSCYRDTYGRGTGRAPKWAWDSCNDDEDKWGALCYPKCNAGYSAKACCLCEPDGGPGIKIPVWDRYRCNDDEELKDSMCYKKPRDGFSCGVTLCDFSRELRGFNAPTDLINGCPEADDTILQDGRCYAKPIDGFTCDGSDCSKPNLI